MGTILEGFAQYLKEHGRSDRTASAYVSDVARFVSWSEAEYEQGFNVSMLNRADLHDYQGYCRETLKLKAATWNRSMASLAVLAEWLKVSGQIDHDPVTGSMSRAENQKLAPKSLRKPEFKKLRLAVAEQVRTARTDAARKQALRDAAVVTCLWQAGMREGEVARLRVQDVLLGERSGRIEIVNAKGNKDRVIPLGYEAAQVMRGWLSVRTAAGDEMFVGKFGEALGTRGIQKLVARLAEKAGIGHVAPHQLRHTCGHSMITQGASMSEVAAFLGHSNLETTRRYTLPHYEDLVRLAEMVA